MSALRLLCAGRWQADKIKRPLLLVHGQVRGLPCRRRAECVFHGRASCVGWAA